MTLLKGVGAYLGIGTAVGIISGLFGIGGGILMVPAIIFIWAKEPKVAVATSLAVMIPVAIAGVARHHFSYGNVDWKIAAGLAVGAIIGSALIGVPLANIISGEALKKGFGILLIIFGLRMTGVFELISAKFTALIQMVIR